MFVKIVTLRKKGSVNKKPVYEHFMTEIHEADSMQVVDKNDPKGKAERTYIIKRKGSGDSFSFVDCKDDDNFRHNIFVENENGDTIGKY